jgi:hypothetical protein
MATHLFSFLFGDAGEGQGATLPAKGVSVAEESRFLPTTAARYTVKASFDLSFANRTGLRVRNSQRGITQGVDCMCVKHSRC